MALTQCAECGNEVSTTARSCPHCGAGPLTFTPKRMSIRARAMGLGCLLMLASGIPFALIAGFREGSSPSASEMVLGAIFMIGFLLALSVMNG
jgi:hypothetical protein